MERVHGGVPEHPAVGDQARRAVRTTTSEPASRNAPSRPACQTSKPVRARPDVRLVVPAVRPDVPRDVPDLPDVPDVPLDVPDVPLEDPDEPEDPLEPD
jgi:hypothetical protein